MAFFSKQQLIQSTDLWAGKKIAVIGDVGLDEYLMGQVRRISPEAPVPVLDVEKEESRLGLAANVAQNIVSLGGKVELISVVGADAGAEFLKSLFDKVSMGWEGMVVEKNRPTTRKTRVMAQHHHLVRVDYEMRKYISPETEQLCLQKLNAVIPNVDALIIEDYAKGVITYSLAQAAIQMAKKYNKLVLVDPPKGNPADFYKGADIIKPNYDEAVALSGLKFDDLHDNPNKVFEVGQAVLQQAQAQHVVLTQGQNGMTIFSKNNTHHVPTFARKVFDVTGAGDTVIAALALGLSAQLDMIASCTLANYAAGVVVGKVGCVPCAKQDLIDYIGSTF